MVQALQLVLLYILLITTILWWYMMIFWLWYYPRLYMIVLALHTAVCPEWGMQEATSWFEPISVVSGTLRFLVKSFECVRKAVGFFSLPFRWVRMLLQMWLRLCWKLPRWAKDLWINYGLMHSSWVFTSRHNEHVWYWHRTQKSVEEEAAKDSIHHIPPWGFAMWLSGRPRGHIR